MGKTRKLRKTRKHIKPRNKYVKTKKRNYKGGAFGRNKRAAAKAASKAAAKAASKAAAEAAVEAAAEKKIQDEIQLKKLNLWLNKFTDYKQKDKDIRGEYIEALGSQPSSKRYEESEYMLVPGPDEPAEKLKQIITLYDETATFTDNTNTFTTGDIIRAVNKGIIYYHFKNIIQKTYNRDEYIKIYSKLPDISFKTVKVYLGFNDDDSVTYIFYPNGLDGYEEIRTKNAIKCERRKIKKNINNYVNIEILDKEVDTILNYNTLTDYIFEPTEEVLFGDGCYQRDGYMIMGYMSGDFPLTHILIEQGKIYEGTDNEITQMITKCIKREKDVRQWRGSYGETLDEYRGDAYKEQYPYDSNASYSGDFRTAKDPEWNDNLFEAIDKRNITIEEY